MMKLLLKLIYIALLVALFYAVKASIAPITWAKFWIFMAGDYPALWHYYIEPNLPPINHPIVLIFFALIALGVVSRVIGQKNGQ